MLHSNPTIARHQVDTTSTDIRHGTVAKPTDLYATLTVFDVTDAPERLRKLTPPRILARHPVRRAAIVSGARSRCQIRAVNSILENVGTGAFHCGVEARLRAAHRPSSSV